MKFSVLSLHPELLKGLQNEGLLGKAIQSKLIDLDLVHLRDFADPPHYRVDDKPFGGGPGMILKLEPIVAALRAIEKQGPKPVRKVVLAAKGKPFTQELAMRWSEDCKHLVLVCGRYEGIDQRVADFYADEEVRWGESVMMGGEFAAAAIIESVARLIPGVLGNQSSLVEETFASNGFFESPQYTRPREFEGHKVPEVLTSGDHSKIQEWKKESSLQ